MSITVGSIIQFGHYPLNADGEDKTPKDKTPIEWQVLDIQNGMALIISKYVLASEKYNEKWEHVTWETCTLRNWLNSYFILDAFTVEEEKRIQTVTVTADRNPKYCKSPGNDTRDKLFLLSITEVTKYFGSKEERMCISTKSKYSWPIAHYCNEKYTLDGDPTLWWWLRSPGYDQNFTAYVTLSGSINYGGNADNHENGGVRPALWINI